MQQLPQTIKRGMFHNPTQPNRNVPALEGPASYLSSFTPGSRSQVAGMSGVFYVQEEGKQHKCRRRRYLLERCHSVLATTCPNWRRQRVVTERSGTCQVFDAFATSILAETVWGWMGTEVSCGACSRQFSLVNGNGAVRGSSRHAVNADAVSHQPITRNPTDGADSYIPAHWR